MRISERFQVDSYYLQASLQNHGSMLDRSWEIILDRDLGALRKGYTNCEEKEEDDDDDATEEVSAL